MKKYRVIGNTFDHGFRIGETVWIKEDDGTNEPSFTNGKNSWWVPKQNVKEIAPSFIDHIAAFFMRTK